MISDQTLEGRQENVSRANKLLWTFATLVEVLNRHRGKGQQKVTIEHVHVHSGDQVSSTLGRISQSEEQFHAKQIAHTPQPAMRDVHEERQAVPICHEAERPVQDTWRAVAARSKK